MIQGGEGTEEEQEPVTPEEEPPKSDEPEIEEDNTPQ